MTTLSRLRFSHVLPNAFAEHGALMAATVLNSQRAVEVSIFIVRAFVRLRAMLLANAELAYKLEHLERKLLAGIQIIHEHDGRLDATEAQIDSIIEAIHALQMPPVISKRPIGFLVDEEE